MTFCAFSGGELQKEDAALLTVLLLLLLLLLLIHSQTCIGLLAYPSPSSAPPEAQFLLQPAFRHTHPHNP